METIAVKDLPVLRDEFQSIGASHIEIHRLPPGGSWRASYPYVPIRVWIKWADDSDSAMGAGDDLTEALQWAWAVCQNRGREWDATHAKKRWGLPYEPPAIRDVPNYVYGTDEDAYLALIKEYMQRVVDYHQQHLGTKTLP